MIIFIKRKSSNFYTVPTRVVSLDCDPLHFDAFVIDFEIDSLLFYIRFHHR